MSTNLYRIIYILDRIWAKCPENWSKFRPKSIDKWAWICPILDTLTLRCLICYAQLHVYLFVDKSIVYARESIVFTLHGYSKTCL